MANFDPDPLNTSSCLLPPSYFDVPEPLDPRTEATTRTEATAPAVTEAINAAIGQQFERMARLSRQLEREQEQVEKQKAAVKALEQKVANTEAAAAKRLASVCADYERKLNVNETLARDALSRLEGERENMMRRANEEEAALIEQLEQTRVSLRSAQEVNAELTCKLKDSSVALSSSLKEAEQLRTFQRWEKDRWQVLDRCAQLEEGVKDATAAADLKQQRLDALQSILALQEAELARHGAGEELEALQGLACRWREKVFALLVQAEAARQTAAREARQGAAARAEVGRELERSRGVVAQLELKLGAAQAELSEERTSAQHLKSKLRDSEAAAAEGLKDRDAWRDAVESLRSCVDASMTAAAAQERQLSVRALGPLAAFERRLQALAERLPVLKAQLKRLHAREAVEQVRAEFESREAELHRELTVVRQDRDRLASHVERDAEEREANETDLRQQYEAQIVTLERNTETMRLELAVKSEALERSQEERDALSANCDALQEERQRLAEQVAALEAARDTAVSAVTVGLYAEHAQQMGELQAALEEVRREHAKAVLSLRQAERDLDRCRAERASEAAALEEAGRRRAAELETELARAAAEANLLRATVRQEGLLRARGAARPAPRVELVEEVETELARATVRQEGLLTARGAARPAPRVELAEEVEEEEEEVKEEEGAVKGNTSPHKAPAEFQPHLVNLIEEVRSLVRSVETSALYGTDEEEDDEE